jgi:hypothetical protein
MVDQGADKRHNFAQLANLPLSQVHSLHSEFSNVALVMVFALTFNPFLVVTWSQLAIGTILDRQVDMKALNKAHNA